MKKNSRRIYAKDRSVPPRSIFRNTPGPNSVRPRGYDSSRRWGQRRLQITFRTVHCKTCDIKTRRKNKYGSARRSAGPNMGTWKRARSAMGYLSSRCARSQRDRQFSSRTTRAQNILDPHGAPIVFTSGTSPSRTIQQLWQEAVNTSAPPASSAGPSCVSSPRDSRFYRGIGIALASTRELRARRGNRFLPQLSLRTFNGG